VSLTDRLNRQVNRQINRGMAWAVRKLLTMVLRKVAPAPIRMPTGPGRAIALERDPWCQAWVSPEVSVTLRQGNEILHFCSDECRARYSESSSRAVNA